MRNYYPRGRKHGTTKDGQSSPLYKVWRDMRRRCFCATNKSYPDYGGRGISICPEWASFGVFAADMGPHPGAGFSLDRINNDADYSKDNCRWASAWLQNRNRRINIIIDILGYSLCLADWCALSGVEPNTASHRMKSGMDPTLAVLLPPREKIKAIAEAMEGR